MSFLKNIFNPDKKIPENKDEQTQESQEALNNSKEVFNAEKENEKEQMKETEKALNELEEIKE